MLMQVYSPSADACRIPFGTVDYQISFSLIPYANYAPTNWRTGCLARRLVES